MFNSEVVIGKSLVKWLSLLKNKSLSHFLKIFQPADSKRSAAFEIQVSHGVWSLPFKQTTPAGSKTMSSLTRKSTQTTVYVMYNFFE